VERRRSPETDAALMFRLADFPQTIFAVSLVALWLCAWAGARFLARFAPRGEEAREDLSVVLAASLTLLGLIVGFTFSMAISRYDQRKNYEEAEANAIGTEYVRVQLLPGPESARAQLLLREYLDQRILFYSVHDRSQLAPLAARTGELQEQLWASVRAPAAASPTPVMALVVAGMNDVLNSQGYTQAAWWNRIPAAAWLFMALIAILCNLMLGYTARHLRARVVLLSVLPVVLAIAFFLIADIDSPRGGIIHVAPQNLLALRPTLR
jgi:hypothetical protein